MASFTERYHELTKYNPETIDKLGPVHWEDQPLPYKIPSVPDKTQLQAYLQSPLKEGDAQYDLATLAHFLHYSLGITAKMETPNGDMVLRANPSAGGLYPTEVYVALRNTKDISDGVYHYHPHHSALYPLHQCQWEDLVPLVLDQDLGKAGDSNEAQWVFLFTGMYARSVWRYKERAYRRILLDTGHALGNFLELAQTFNFNASVFGGFYDRELGEFLNLNPKEEAPLVGLTFYSSDLAHEQKRSSSGLTTNTVKQVDRQDPMYLQQNSCEQIRKEIGDGIPPQYPLVDYSGKEKPRLENAFYTLAHRRSCREYSGDSISKEQMLEILQFAYGRCGNVQWSSMGGHLQSTLMVLRVEGVPPGIYEFDAQSENLTQIKEGDLQGEAYQMCLGQNLAPASAFSLIHSTDLSRLTEDFGERGYRYACLESGVLGERINLKTQEMNLGASGIGGYFDDLVNDVLGLPLSHGIIYITTVGVPA